MPAALGICGFETPHIGSVTFTGRFGSVESHPNYVADVRPEYTACSSALSDPGVFHRDVSLGNIMVALDGEGKLNDWDL